MRYTADFETTTKVEDCRVWSFGLCNIDNHNDFIFGHTIEEFMEHITKIGNSTLYFHNLKFDGEFIIDALFRNGYKHVEDRNDLETKTFTTLISDKGLFYSMDICIYKKNKFKHIIHIKDSYKMIPLAVEKISETFGIEEKKLDIDYKKHRPIGYIMTKDELMYLKNDCVIMAKALSMVFELGHTKMTQGSNALTDYKNRLKSKYEFLNNFPTPSYDVDRVIRQSYKGGYTYCAERFKGKEIDNGIVYDVNSLYPYVMRHKILPYGMPVFFEGKYKHDKLYDLYVQCFSCEFELRKGYLPTIQLKGNNMFISTEYVKTSNGKEVTMCLTHLDLELFLKHYKVKNIEYHSGWKFKGKTGLFDDYIDEWSKTKIESKDSGNDGMYMYSKLMLNALYGKFAKNPNAKSKIPYLDKDEDRVKYAFSEPEKIKPIYIPLGSYITSWARYITISTAQENYDRFVYADTDSIHLTGWEKPKNLNVDSFELGAWKEEYKFEKAKYLRAKAYIDVLCDNELSWFKKGNIGPPIKTDKLHITCAG